MFLQLTLLHIAGALLIATLLFRFSEITFSESIRSGFDLNGRIVAESLAKSLEIPLANREIVSVQAGLDASLKIPNVEWAYVTSPDGRVLADTFVPKFPDSLPRSSSEKTLRQIQMPGTNKPILLVTEPVLDGIFGSVHVGLGEEKLLASISHMKFLIVVTLVGAKLILILIVAVVTRRIVAPIRALTEASRAMAADLTGEFQPLKVSSRNEIGTLTESFNRMIIERQEYRKNLESKVWERTEDLFQANCELDNAKIRAESASDGLKKANEALKDEAAERSLLEGQLVQAQKLESIGHLAAGVAHEINTPIQYIGDNCLFLKTSFADLGTLLDQHVQLLKFAKALEPNAKLIQDLEQGLAAMDADFLMEEIPKAIEQSIEGVGRVSEIVRAMKEFSHPGSGEKAPVDLNHAIVNTLAVCRNEVKYVANVTTELDTALPPVCCLLGEINQVVLNLVVNAAHALEGTKQEGEMGSIKIVTRLDGDIVEIRVQDDGPGIPEAIRDRIFDPFFTTKEVGKGTGQGLAIARNAIVKKHGGTLTFETEENVGTTFIIRIPWAGSATKEKISEDLRVVTQP